MADRIYLHFAAGGAGTTVRYTARDGLSWASLTTPDPSAREQDSYHELEPRASGNNVARRREAIQVALVHANANSAAGVIKLYAVRGNFLHKHGAFTTNRCQRLIARIEVANGAIVFSRSRFRESLPPRRNNQHNHKPTGNSHSRRYKVFCTPRSMDVLPPNPGPAGLHAPSLRASPGLTLFHGGLHIAFSPQARIVKEESQEASGPGREQSPAMREAPSAE